MVCGADTILEFISKGKSEITLFITELSISGTNPIYCHIQEHNEDGAWYNVWGDNGIREYGKIWLSNIIHNITNEYPEEFCVYVLNYCTNKIFS